MDKKTSSSGKIAGAVGLAAGVVAAAAAAVYFYGMGGKDHRKELTAWSKKAKMEMLAKIKQMKNVTKEAYHKAAEEVLTKYKQVKNINPAELQTFAQELKSHWNKISAEAKKLGNQPATKTIKK